MGYDGKTGERAPMEEIATATFSTHVARGKIKLRQAVAIGDCMLHSVPGSRLSNLLAC